MPTQIDLQDRPVELSPEFKFLHAGGDDVVVSAWQGSSEKTDDQVLKEGDTVDEPNQLTAYTSGEARLLQFSHEESFPESSPAPKKKSKKS